MKRISIVAFIALLSGCAGGSYSTQLVTSTAEEAYSPTQVVSIEPIKAAEAVEVVEQKPEPAVAKAAEMNDPAKAESTPVAPKAMESAVGTAAVATAAVAASSSAITEKELAPIASVEAMIQAEPAPVPEKTVIAKKPQPKQTVIIKGENEYTIQVLALSHDKGYQTYLNKLPSDQPVWMNKKMINGIPWYTLLFGEYGTKAEAKKALNALPADVKAYGPFVRSLKQIKTSQSPKLKKLN